MEPEARLPAELVADTFSVFMEGVPNNWTATLFFTTNHTPIFASTPVFLRGGDGQGAQPGAVEQQCVVVSVYGGLDEVGVQVGVGDELGYSG